MLRVPLQAGRKLTTPGSATVELPASGGGFFVAGKSGFFA
jgi:hypothetical protein